VTRFLDRFAVLIDVHIVLIFLGIYFWWERVEVALRNG